MFLVKPNTVELLFGAQKAELRGRLRLDVSSRRFPADPAQPLDLRSAGEAVGERVVRLLKGCAADAALFGGKYDVFPPAPDADGRLRIMPSPDAFEQFVLTRLGDVLGLDPGSPDYDPAIRSLAGDFTDWARHDPEARGAFGVEIDPPAGPAVIRCAPPPPAEYAPLDPGGPAGRGDPKTQGDPPGP